MTIFEYGKYPHERQLITNRIPTEYNQGETGENADDGTVVKPKTQNVSEISMWGLIALIVFLMLWK